MLVEVKYNLHKVSHAAVEPDMDLVEPTKLGWTKQWAYTSFGLWICILQVWEWLKSWKGGGGGNLDVNQIIWNPNFISCDSSASEAFLIAEKLTQLKFNVLQQLNQRRIWWNQQSVVEQHWTTATSNSSFSL